MQTPMRQAAEGLVIDDLPKSVFRVNRRAFTDPAVLEAERRLVFDQCWLYVGHESELPEPGSFIKRKVGGRPVIFVPYIQKAGLKLDRIMVCWDGSRAATRAIADALPFLKKAKQVEIVMVSTKKPKDDEVAGADLGQHLARHGLTVDVKRITTTDTDVSSTILSYAADSSTDFIVMGGYGHSRLREFILGGVTRGLFASMTVPVLMSH